MGTPAAPETSTAKDSAAQPNPEQTTGSASEEPQDLEAVKAQVQEVDNRAIVERTPEATPEPESSPTQEPTADPAPLSSSTPEVVDDEQDLEALRAQVKEVEDNPVIKVFVTEIVSVDDDKV